jgi:hypothetical protein
MTAEWYDLGQRLHAAAAGTVARRLAGSPVHPYAARLPVAVRARQARGQVTVRAAAPGTGEHAAAGPAALTLLHDLGVTITAAQWATLITDDTATLPALLGLARTAGPDGDHAAAAAHLAWWADRADYPGSTATVALTAASAEQWITGTDPAAERKAATWRTWLHIPGDDCPALLDWLGHLLAAAPLAGLDPIAEDDQRSWGSAQREHADRRDWRRPDTVARAATGLRTRCDAADLYQAALLDDPAYRQRAAHTGHVTAGTATVTRDGRRKTMTVTCDRMDTRLREGSDIAGWAGTPADIVTDRFRGTVEDATVQGGALVLVLSGVGWHCPATGSRVTLIPAPPPRQALESGRYRYQALYSTRTSWLTTGRTPAPARRDVPLDVLVAAADPAS